MTNEQAKQEAIKKAFEECGIELGEFKPHLNNFSQFISVLHPDLCDILDDREIGGPCRIRPKSLKGIEKNNGWVRIEEDGSNLPKFGVYKWLDRNGFIKEEGFNPNYLINHVEFKRAYSHYKPVEKDLKPIY